MDSIKVSDCMSHQFVSFSPETPVVEAAMELIKNELLGGPVVDSQGKLLGWISEQDCIGVVTQVLYYDERVAQITNVMNPVVDMVNEGQSAMDLAEEMKKHKRKIYPVVDDNKKVVGVISRRHILRQMLKVVTETKPHHI